MYGWVEVHPVDWARVLRMWLDVRKELVRDFSIPITRELHGTDYVQGRGKVSTAPPERYSHNDPERGEVVLWKDLGRDVAEFCLGALRDCAELRCGSVFRWEPGGDRAWGQAKYALYRDFVHELDAELRTSRTHALISMDGDDRHYRDAHRSLRLDSRHVIEDPAMHDSRVSQWTQMADLVAYTANMTLNSHHGNAFGRDWYRDYLSLRDPHGRPRELPRRTAGPA